MPIWPLIAFEWAWLDLEAGAKIRGYAIRPNVGSRSKGIQLLQLSQCWFIVIHVDPIWNQESLEKILTFMNSNLKPSHQCNRSKISLLTLEWSSDSASAFLNLNQSNSSRNKIWDHPKFSIQNKRVSIYIPIYSDSLRIPRSHHLTLSTKLNTIENLTTTKKTRIKIKHDAQVKGLINDASFKHNKIML